MVTSVVEDQKMSGFNRPTTILSVPLTSSITLEAGSFSEEGDTLTILPPSVAMFDQLVNWLSRQTPPDPGAFSTAMIGIGATALCLRWGTFLAVLLEHKPLFPETQFHQRNRLSGRRRQAQAVEIFGASRCAGSRKPAGIF